MLTHDGFKAYKARQVLSERQIDMMQHALGLDYKKPYKRNDQYFYKPYRNSYDAVGEDATEWDNLVEKGFATKGRVYHVSLSGITILSDALQTYIYSDNATCIADAKGAVIDILIADACYCGYGCWIPTAAKDIARRARLPLSLTLDTLHFLQSNGDVAKTYYGECDDEGYPFCYHGWVLTKQAKESTYKGKYDKAWKAECDYLDKILKRSDDDEDSEDGN